jgi:hypothetical protein
MFKNKQFSIEKNHWFSCQKIKNWSLFIFLFCSVLFITFFPAKTYAATRLLVFDPSPDSRVVGYKLYYEESGKSMITVNLGSKTSYELSNLTEGATYYFAASAYDKNGNESDLSEVLTYTVTQNEIIIDNSDGISTSKTGTWGDSDAPDPYGKDSVWSRDGTIFTWHFKPTQTSYYELMMWWTQWSSRSNHIPVDIEHADGKARVYIDQTRNGGKWNSLGDYFFESGKSYRVTITSQAGPTSTCADAVRFLPIFEPPEDIIIDNRNTSATSRTGTWGVSGGYYPYGTDSLWSRDGTTFTWHFSPAQTSYYNLMMWWTQWSSRSSKVPVKIEHAYGSTTVVADQTKNSGQWNSLGNYFFEFGKSYRVTITSQPGPSSTCADAVRFSTN